MPRKPKSVLDAVYADNRSRQADLAREFEHMNKVAARRIANTAAVIEAGAIRNAVQGILPLMNDRRQRRRVR
jgi:hypothetical protein